MAPLGCFLFADLFRYHNDVMRVESLAKTFSRHFAGIVLLLLVYFKHKHKQHEARSIVNNKHTRTHTKKRIRINNGQQYSLASLGCGDMAG